MTEEDGVGDKEEENKNEEDEGGFDENLELDDMSGSCNSSFFRHTIHS